MKAVFAALGRLMGLVLALPFMVAAPLTLQEFVAAARAAIQGGKLDEAETLTKQASALKALEGLGVAGEADEANELPAPAKPKGAPLVAAPNIKRVTKPGFSDEPIEALKTYIRRGDQIAARAALQEDTDSEGGFLVPDDFYGEVIQKRNKMSIARAMGAQVITTSLKVVNVPVEATEATDFVLTAEEAAANQNEPTFGEVPITAYKYSKLVKVSDELMGDESANLESYLANVFARREATTENEMFITGTGTGQPQGALTAATLAVTAASASTISASEVKALYYALPSQYRQEADHVAWTMLDSVEGVIRALQGSDFLFAESPGGGQQGDLLGRRVFNSDSMPAFAVNAKTLLVGNWWYYLIVERQALAIRRLNELYAVNGQIGLLATFRRGGAVTQAAAFRYLKQAAS